MAYEYKPTETKYEIHSIPMRSFGVTTAGPSTVSMEDIAIPSDLQGEIKHAYLHFSASIIYTAAGGADIDGDQYIQIQVGAGGWQNAILIPDNSFVIGSASNFTSYFPVTGTIDIASHIAKGDTVQVQWTDALAATGSLTFMHIQQKLILYMGN